MCERMAEKLVSASMCEQRAVIQFLNTEGRNGSKIHSRLNNVYTKAISQSNVYEWIKKFNEGCTQLHDKVPYLRKIDSSCYACNFTTSYHIKKK